MEIKKSEKADLERKKSLFIQIGLVVVMLITLMGFEWKSYEKENIVETSVSGEAVIEEVVLQTEQETKPEPPPPAQQTTVLNIVDNTVEVTNTVEIDAEDNNDANKEYQKVEEAVVEDATETEIFTVVEESPSYPGGSEAIDKFLTENIVYPAVANESGVQGKVFITFVVEKGGNITDVKIKRDIGGGCGEEAVRVIKKMPKWKPGLQRGKPVRVQFVLPVNFTLN